MDHTEQVLIRNGFSNKEAAVYLCLLEMGELPVSQIALKTHLNRSTTYAIVDSLKVKTYVSVCKKNGIEYFSALSPEILIEGFKRSVRLAEEILPSLLNKLDASPLKPRIQFFDGLEGIKQVLQEFSQSRVKAMGFTDYEQMPDELLEFIKKEVIPERKKNKNKARFLVPNNAKNKEIKAQDSKNYAEHRISNFHGEKNPIELLLFGFSGVAFLSFIKNERFAFIVDSPAIHKTLKNIFSLVWRQAK